jgi:hypothetical protein
MNRIREGSVEKNENQKRYERKIKRGKKEADEIREVNK